MNRCWLLTFHELEGLNCHIIFHTVLNVNVDAQKIHNSCQGSYLV